MTAMSKSRETNNTSNLYPTHKNSKIEEYTKVNTFVNRYYQSKFIVTNIPTLKTNSWLQICNHYARKKAGSYNSNIYDFVHIIRYFEVRAVIELGS